MTANSPTVRNDYIVDAVLAAPVPVAVLAVIPAVITGPIDITQLFGALVLMYFVGLLATFAFGVPLFLLMRRFGLANAWTAAASGLAVGWAMSIATNWPDLPPRGALLLASFAGLLSSLVFWWTLVARNRTPPPVSPSPPPIR